MDAGKSMCYAAVLGSIEGRLTSKINKLMRKGYFEDSSQQYLDTFLLACEIYEMGANDLHDNLISLDKEV